jgi:tripartite-type tricarboxylate transporter receptor subunit TctC
MNRRLLTQASVALLTITAALAAQAQAYPTRPVTVVVPFATGSASDVFTRVVLDHIAARGKFRFIVDNRPAAGGNVGTQQVAKAAPDGYTLLMSSSGPLAANSILVKNLGYDPDKDFEPIALFAVVPNVIVVSTKLPINSLSDLISYAKSNPKELNYGSVGIGSSQHLAGSLFEQLTGTKLVHVPYRVTSQMVTDMISGQVQLGFQLLPNVKGLIVGGQVRPLAVASGKRLPALPNVPTAKEAGLAGYESAAWFAFLAPRGTPRAAIDKFHAELAMTIADSSVRARLHDLGAEPTISTPAELALFIRAETDKLREIITKGGITLEQ